MSDNLDRARAENEAKRQNFATEGEGGSIPSGYRPPTSATSPEGVILPASIAPDNRSLNINNNPLLDSSTEELQPGLVTAAADAAEDSQVIDETVPLAQNETDGVTEAPVITGKRRKSFWREVLETVILTILIFFMVKSLIQNFRIQGSSMEPNFHTNQLLLVNKASYFHFDANAWLRIIPWVKADGTNVVWIFGGPHRGDVLVLEPPDVPTEDYIKRVIGLPGDRLEVRDGTVYINDKPLKEPYIKEKPYNTYGPVTVPSGNVFVMGDNRNASRDSRVFGFLPFDKIVGKAMFVYWPFGAQWGAVPDTSYEP